MEKKAIEQEIINIFNLFRASIDRDFLKEMCSKKGLLLDSDNDLKEKFASMTLVATIDHLFKMADKDTYNFINLLEKYISWDKNLNDQYPAAMEQFRKQKVNLKKIFKDVVINPLRGKEDEETLNNIVQWVAVEVLTDAKQSGESGEKSVFQIADNKIMEGDSDYNIGGLLREMVRDAKNLYYRTSKKDDKFKKTIEDADDLRKEISQLEGLLKKEDDEEGKKSIETKLEKKNKELKRLENNLKRIQQSEVQTLKGPTMEKGQDPSTMTDPSKDPDSIMSGVDYFNERATESLKKDFKDYGMEKGNPMAKKILDLTLNPESGFDYKKPKKLPKNDGKPTRKNPRGLPSKYEDKSVVTQLMNALDVDNYKEVEKGLDNIKEMLIDFSVNKKDVDLMDHLEHRRLLPLSMVKKIKDKRKELDENKKKMEEKFPKKKSNLEIKMAHIVDYLETLLKRI